LVFSGPDPVKLASLNVLLTVVTIAVIMAMMMIMIVVVVIVMVMTVVMVVIMVMIVAMVVVVMMMVMMLVVVVFVVISVPVAPAGWIISVIIAVAPVATVIRRSRSGTERYSAESDYSGDSKGWWHERPAEACLFRHGALLWLARAITLLALSAFHFVPLAISCSRTRFGIPFVRVCVMATPLRSGQSS